MNLDWTPARSAALRLCLTPGVGSRTRKALLERFQSAEGVLAAAMSELREVEGVGPKLAKAIAAAGELDLAPEISACEEGGVEIVLDIDRDYPESLQTLADPPGALYCRGAFRPHDSLAVAIVGTRHATHYGLTQAAKLAGSLARAGYVVVSGLARGIDAAAHQGALKAGGRTLAVLGSGVLNIYPPEHEALADEIANHGVVLGENPPRSPALGGMFPQRNRIISGLSLGVIVVEADKGSGALITARHATEQNRDIFAVPGPVDSRVSHGCHRLIRDGAKLVETVEDVLEELGPLTKATTTPDGTSVHHPAELQLNEVERAVLAAIGTKPVSVDEVVAAGETPTARVLAILSVLEMRRLIRRVGGNRVVRV